MTAAGSVLRGRSLIMVPVMKPTIVLLFSSLAVAFAAPPKPELLQVHKVYLLPMTNAMEQYLANRLTGLGVFQVVTDPNKADAIFTDGIGASFESRLADLFPERPVKRATEETKPAVVEEAAPAVAAQPPAAGNPPAAATPASGVALTPPQAAAAPATPAPAPTKVAATESDKQDATADGSVGRERIVPVTAFHRAKGTLFLVDPHSRLVLWSIYAQPKDASPVEMDRMAATIANRIRQDLKSH
ncbi:MAG TPA: hypothetical protein VN893_01260 [Bryobacteraceae bacterium]|nr:hypothetical protein [Bryobacteraceae bacterium]